MILSYLLNPLDALSFNILNQTLAQTLEKKKQRRGSNYSTIYSL
jgi:hypothetical protein